MDIATFAAVQQLGLRLSTLDTRLRFSYSIFSSSTWTAPADGLAIVRSLAPGGSGAGVAGTSSDYASVTGGYAGAWGGKFVRVKKGQQIVVVHGAAGAAITCVTVGQNGKTAGNNIVTIAGVAYTVPGGLGGIYASGNGVAPVMPTASVLPAGWDFGADSVRPGFLASSATVRLAATGGAGVDIMMQGNNATASASTGGSGGGGTIYQSVGGRGGGFLPSGANAIGALPGTTDPAAFYDASKGEWGISFYGGNGGVVTSTAPFTNAGNGGGGGGITAAGGGPAGNGGNGGGGGGVGATSTAVCKAGNGGLGAGGGGCFGPSSGITGSNYSGAGGDAFTHIEFFANVLS